MKNHPLNPGACDAIEGMEGVAFRHTAPNPNTTSISKTTAIAAGAVAATGAVAVLVTMNDTALFKKLLVDTDKLMEECANWAERKINQEQLGGKRLDAAECNEKVGTDPDTGKPVTRAMQLGAEKHKEAFKCVEESLGKLIRGHYSIEQRYRYDRETGKLELVSTDEEQQLLRQGRKRELKGTIQPDVVVHSGDPLMVRAVYDFKFPCIQGALPTWSIYTKPPYQDLTQGEVYREAFKVTPARVTPGKKVIRR
ncbi:hypothetical protein F0U61_16945 [Archangium violaceum]|uniref:hypothetical protein n=1 Tax=Archangium violaceum TaxID=83451 RepID=UPI002B2C2E2A|nr:hypothetical protein F0U61_16945 [Archangium violaceum]